MNFNFKYFDQPSLKVNQTGYLILSNLVFEKLHQSCNPTTCMLSLRSNFGITILNFFNKTDIFPIVFINLNYLFALHTQRVTFLFSLYDLVKEEPEFLKAETNVFNMDWMWIVVVNFTADIFGQLFAFFTFLCWLLWNHLKISDERSTFFVTSA